MTTPAPSSPTIPRVYNMLAWTYPLILHICLYLDEPAVAAYYLALLLAWPLVIHLLQRQRPGRLEPLGAAMALLLVTLQATHTMVIFKLLPVLINGTLLVLFSASLRLGATPIITRLAQLMKPSLSDAERAYTRGVTILWTLVFLVMGTLSAILAVAASTATWSWFTNVASYLIVAVIFLAEFAIRRRVLGADAGDSLPAFLKKLARVNPRRAILQAPDSDMR